MLLLVILDVYKRQSYVMAHALYLRGEYGRSLGMAENALIMKQGSYPISELFLHLAASMACMSLKDIDAAKTHFGAAWDIARPDGLIELIGEHHGLLQGLIEACLKTQYPDDFAHIIEITYRFSYGWRRIHNPDSGEDVAVYSTSFIALRSSFTSVDILNLRYSFF